MPLLPPPHNRAGKTGDFCDAKITTPEMKLQPKSAKKPAILLGEIESRPKRRCLEHKIRVIRERLNPRRDRGADLVVQKEEINLID